MPEEVYGMLELSPHKKTNGDKKYEA